jgi:putative transposase
MQASNWKWHLDEVFVKINGERHYLWRAVDHEGEVPESVETKRTNKDSALKMLKALINVMAVRKIS